MSETQLPKILDWAEEMEMLENRDYSPPSPSYVPQDASHTPPGSPPAKRRQQQEPQPQQQQQQHKAPIVPGHVHVAAIKSCNMEMLADKVFGLVVTKARRFRSGCVAEYGADEYTKNPVTGQKVYYNTLFNFNGNKVDYIGQMERAVLKISNGKLKMCIEKRSSFVVSLQEA